MLSFCAYMVKKTRILDILSQVLSFYVFGDHVFEILACKCRRLLVHGNMKMALLVNDNGEQMHVNGNGVWQ